MSDQAEEPIDYFEEERRERAQRELRRSILPTDSAATIFEKCCFQDDVKHAFVSPDQDFIKPLLPSRRRRR